MYCSSCGNTVSKGLSFCNKCGAPTGNAKERDANQLSESSFNLLVASLIGIPLAGIGLIIGLITVMKRELNFDLDMIGLVTFMSFMLLIIAEIGLFVLLLSFSRRKKVKEPENQFQLNDAATRALGEAQFQNVVTPQAGSVTENTTRNFAPVDRESNSER